MCRNVGGGGEGGMRRGGLIDLSSRVPGNITLRLNTPTNMDSMQTETDAPVQQG